MRKHLLPGALMLITSFLHFQSEAQQQAHQCGTSEQQQKLFSENPDLAADYQEFIRKNAHIASENGRKRLIYTVPVVFHILHEYGSENITDAQVYNQVDILNEDFRKLNDQSALAPAFTAIAADCQIEFRLAALDPEGNCTNGIEHIYSHETRGADDWSKLNQWDRSNYLNIWVVDNLALEGASGFSYLPALVNGSLFYLDGIILLNSYTGSIGTSHTFTSQSLTHEIGHWLGLMHPWGTGSGPGVTCGDDAISDTPVTRGFDNCSVIDPMICTPGIVENVQNFMEFSFCQLMFTEGQAAFLQNALNDETAERNNLWTAQNHEATGIDLTDPLCVPVADFSVSKTGLCAGVSVTYKDVSWKAGVSSRQWSFPGGTPASSTDQNPVVTYAADGIYSAKLIVSNAAGSDSMIMNTAVQVSGNWAAFTGPAIEAFEDGSANWWTIQNPEANFGKFELSEGTGKDQSTSYALKNYRDISQAPLHSDDWFYVNRLGNSRDNLISPSFDLSGTTNVSISFDYAYATNATAADDTTELLKVYSSKDCGATWVIRKTISASDLVTASAVPNTGFIPVNNSQWKTAAFNYNANTADTRTRFRFEFTAADQSNHFYIDNINISGTLGIDDNDGIAGILVSPNPVLSGSAVSVEIAAANLDVQLQLVDVNGQLISTTVIGASNGTQTVSIPVTVAKGCYFLQAIRGNSRATHRLIVF